ncbi:MAG: hypothetical protein ACLGIT_08980 [Gammaproteobacteria bacterium]
MDWAYKAVLTGIAVAAVMMAARLLGRHAAGMFAGLPIISVPAIAWLVAEQGVEPAVLSAVGGLAACTGAIVFALVFDHAARRHGAAGALWRALLALGAALALLGTLGSEPPLLLVLSLVAALLAWRRVARSPSPAGWVRTLRGEPWLSASLAGLVSAGASQLAVEVGPFWTGVIAALPIISGFALVHLRRAGAPGDIRRFVRGYVPGVAAKAMFLFSFAMLAPRTGAAWSLALAGVVGAATALAWSARASRTGSGHGLETRAGQ